MRHGGWSDRKNAFRWLLLLGLAGAAAMILADWAVPKPAPPAATDGSPSSSPGTGGRAETAGHGVDPFREYEEAYQKKLKELLESIAGVGEVDVSVTIDSTEETVLQQNERDSQQTTDEQDAAGTKRRTTQITREGQIALYETSASQTPVVVKKSSRASAVSSSSPTERAMPSYGRESRKPSAAAWTFRHTAFPCCPGSRWADNQS